MAKRYALSPLPIAPCCRRRCHTIDATIAAACFSLHSVYVYLINTNTHDAALILSLLECHAYRLLRADSAAMASER